MSWPSQLEPRTQVLLAQGQREQGRKAEERQERFLMSMKLLKSRVVLLDRRLRLVAKQKQKRKEIMLLNRRLRMVEKQG